MTEEFDPEELRHIRARLLGFEARCAQAAEFIHPDGDLDRARGMYAPLKQDLRAEVNFCETHGDGLPRSAICFYAPAVRKAIQKLRSATNTDPIKSNWRFALTEAGQELSYYRCRLDEFSPI